MPCRGAGLRKSEAAEPAAGFRVRGPSGDFCVSCPTDCLSFSDGQGNHNQWRFYGLRHPLQPVIQAMHSEIEVIPTLPSRALPATITFYATLGFEGELIGDGYAILTRGPIELHFFPHPELKPDECYSGCYVRLNDVDELYSEFLAARLPSSGIPRLERVEDKPWGMREFALLDNDGNLIKFGRVI